MFSLFIGHFFEFGFFGIIFMKSLLVSYEKLASSI